MMQHDIATTVREGKVYADVSQIAELVQEVAEAAGSFTCYQLATILRKLNKFELEKHAAKLADPAAREEIDKLESLFGKPAADPEKEPNDG